MAKNITVKRESSSGRNLEFKDPNKSGTMTRVEFVEKIEAGKYPDYHVRRVNGLKTPVSNPDRRESNNLD